MKSRYEPKSAILKSATYGSDKKYDTLTLECEDGQRIKFGISKFQGCFENFGIRVHRGERYVGSDFDFDAFLGLEIELIQYKNIKPESLQWSSVGVEVTFKGGESALIEIYNEHNGYYPHEYLVEYGDWVDRDCGL